MESAENAIQRASPSPKQKATNAQHFDQLSDAKPDEMAKLLGECLIAIEAREHVLTLRFENGYELTVTGARWDGCCLGVEVEKAT